MIRLEQIFPPLYGVTMLNFENIFFTIIASIQLYIVGQILVNSLVSQLKEGSSLYLKCKECPHNKNNKNKKEEINV